MRNRALAMLLGGAVAVAAGVAPGARAALPDGDPPGVVAIELAPSPLVRRVQELLRERGAYFGAVDGRLNDETVDAVRNYQIRAGLEANGRINEALLDHMEFTSRAIELGARLAAVREAQIEAAAAALRAQPETRDLVEGARGLGPADLTRDPGPCFALPTTSCLLDEALASARAVHRDRFRDWVLGEIATVQARSGSAGEAMQTAAMIFDPRLVIAALRDIAIARAGSGEVDQALAVAALIPEPLARARATAAAAKAAAIAGDAATVHRVVPEVIALAARLPDEQTPASFLAELGAALGRAGSGDADWALHAARDLARRGGEADRSGAAAALAAAGHGDEAAVMLESIAAPGLRRPVLVALAVAAADAGGFAAALAWAAEVDEARYQAPLLARIASAQGEAGDRAGALATLRAAGIAARGIDERMAYARSLALRELAAASLRLGLARSAAEIASGVPDASVRAALFWSVAAEPDAAADVAALARAGFVEAAAAIQSAMDRSWLYGNLAVRAAATGDAADAAALLARALAEAREIGDAWARAQALARLAETFRALGR